jgi:hypothetical protein
MDAPSSSDTSFGLWICLPEGSLNGTRPSLGEPFSTAPLNRSHKILQPPVNKLHQQPAWVLSHPSGPPTWKTGRTDKGFLSLPSHRPAFLRHTSNELFQPLNLRWFPRIDKSICPSLLAWEEPNGEIVFTVALVADERKWSRLRIEAQLKQVSR